MRRNDSELEGNILCTPYVVLWSCLEFYKVTFRLSVSCSVVCVCWKIGEKQAGPVCHSILEWSKGLDDPGVKYRFNSVEPRHDPQVRVATCESCGEAFHANDLIPIIRIFYFPDNWRGPFWPRTSRSEIHWGRIFEKRHENVGGSMCHSQIKRIKKSMGPYWH